MAGIVAVFAVKVPMITVEKDVILPVARKLREVYATSDDTKDDGNDYAGRCTELNTANSGHISQQRHRPGSEDGHEWPNRSAVSLCTNARLSGR